ncbi:MAG: DEAD/DEAH box helicase [Candidatus Eisenbacteria bacterium]|uniref:DEAD/DEAH box helicase n=1 Tax=Eiseniibacteriota bacterium TaxID=2212470 RepID=A0A849SMD5_UNCEI|nr:DEAD/DEAH box helicase [Candidatus Eisenbacteria bacterium]
MHSEPARFLDVWSEPRSTADPISWLRDLGERPEHRGAIAHWHVEPARLARHGALSWPLPAPLAEALETQGVEQLYSHQVHAIERLRARLDTVIVTGTASGKSLCYHAPVIERLLEDPDATALYLFPTKALAQDQLRGLTRLSLGHPQILKRLRAGVYDGDTQASTRRKLRDDANVILSNPDMLHAGILPQHPRWVRFLSRLRYVVVDEMHVYRGIFGSHVANVLRRLERVIAHYGGDFRYVMCSATIRNPGELATALTGREVAVVDDDGSPRGERHFVLWNPPYLDDSRSERRSSNGDGSLLLAGLVERGAQTIAFTKSRVAAELVYRYAHERLERSAPELAGRLSPYRGGYLPEDRRRIERALFSGELRGVVSTNALELGIDVGSLDAAVLIGAPPTLASAWQQAGRAGRRNGAALALLVAYNETVDQYLMRHPDWFFGRSPEAACIDPGNPYILAQQLACAAYELPLTLADRTRFGALAGRVLEALDEAGQTRTLEGRSYWAQTDFPAQKVNLRAMSDDTYTILDASRDNAVIGNVDAISGLELVYPDAIYLHEGQTMWVRSLDLEQKVAIVEPRPVDYYTQPVLDTHVHVRGERETLDWHGERVRFGDLTYAWQTVAMKKIRFGTRDALGYHPLSLPRLTLETAGFWITPGEATLRELARRGHSPWESLSGVRNLFLTLLAMISMCDAADLGGVLDSSNVGAPTLFLFDRYPGGLGFAEQGFARLDELTRAALEHLRACPCEGGCPSCTGLPILRPAQQQDPDLGRARSSPSKEGAQALLSTWARESSRG